MSHRLRKELILGLFGLLGSLAFTSETALALDPKKAITQYVHDVWRVEDGLPSNVLSLILQTRDGYLWIGTQGSGLVRFDGVRFTVFNEQNTPAIKGSSVAPFYEDRAGNLWISSASGLIRYKNGKFTRYTTKDGLPDDHVAQAYEDRAGSLWMVTSGGLSRFQNETFTAHPLKEILPGNISSVCEDRAGNLWVGTWDSGLYRLKDGKSTVYTTRDGLLHNVVWQVLEDQAGNFWIATKHGLNRFKDGKFSSYTTRDGLSDNRATRLYEDRKGNVWIGTEFGGLNRFEDGRFTSFTTKGGLSDNRVESVYEDREGSLWVATWGGLNRFRDGKVTTYTTKEGLVHDWAYPVYEDRAGNLWVGTRGGLTCFKKDGAVTNYTTRDGLAHNVVRAIHEDRAGNLWIGTGGGVLNLFKDGRFIRYATNDELVDNDVRTIYEDRQGNLWIGRYDQHGHPIKFSRERFITSTGEKGVGQNVLFVALEDRAGNLWFGGYGLFQLKDGKLMPIGQDAFGRQHVMALYEDDQGSLWIGTYGNGLWRLKDEKFTRITTAQGLADDWVYQILDDDRGNLWISSNRGIYRVSKQELNNLADGKIASVTCVINGKADGMREIECNGSSQSSGCKTRDGRLWFPTIKGVVMIDPANIPTNTLLPPVYVAEVKIDGSSIDLGNKATLQPGKKDFEFHYTALSYLDPSRVRFKYKLEGYDDHWVDADTRRVAYFTNLSPGEYRFRVIACNNDGLWNEAGAAFEFYLRPHFYQTGWVYTLMGVVLALVGPGVYYVRVQQMKARQRELEMLVEARTKDLAELNQNLGQRVQEGVKALAEAERMAAYGQMVATVAHEVRHPIFGVRTAAYVLKENFEDREQAMAMLDTIDSETKRMINVMNDLLEFARPKPLLPAPTDPRQLLEDVVKTYRAEHGSPQSPDIVLAPNPALPQIVVDRDRLLQVLVNLIENAAKHAEGVTTVTLTMDLVDGAPHVGRGTAELCIRVHDDGAGVQAEHLPHLFEPFFTTGHGTGLGLAIVQRIVKEHGGVIFVESSPGQGTTFSICLPSEPPPGEIPNPKHEIRNSIRISNPND
jgi:ligand-binding sensor domain-containing protein/signal transduction histidine kinase